MLKNKNRNSAPAPPLAARKDPGLIAAKKFARKHDAEPGHAFQVAKIATQIFALTRDLHGLGPAELRLLTAAAYMHDTGYGVRPMSHHKGARKLILESNLSGFNERELKIVACVARYHRKAHPAKSHRVYCDLDPASQHLVDQLAALLRIADGLDRGHDAATRAVRIQRTTNGLRFYIDQRRPSAIDLDGAMRKRALFEEVYGLAVEVLPDDSRAAPLRATKETTPCAE
ncbi:MAG: HD domain-containing protein [Candidatus Hydrogenedentes bacterium]|nr:HD domain-containing protein [Candidatus Hydrogenedentota bacterium]